MVAGAANAGQNHRGNQAPRVPESAFSGIDAHRPARVKRRP